MKPVTCKHHDQACHDEEHDSEVDEENGICQQLVRHDGFELLRLA